MRNLSFLKLSLIACFVTGALSSCLRSPEVQKAEHAIPIKTVQLEIPSQDPKIALVENYLRSLHDEGKFNGAMLLASKGTVVYKNAGGIADFGTNDSIDLNTTFQLASVSKQFTAVSVMQLEEKQVIDYNCVIEDFFPDFPYKNITIHELLTHRSGLPKYEYFTDRYWKDPSVAMNNQDLLKLMTKYKPRAYNVPGKRFYYNNINYCILAAIVEKASGLPFEKYVKENFFVPLGMEHTVIFNLASGSNVVNPARGYDTVRG